MEDIMGGRAPWEHPGFSDNHNRVAS